MPNLRHVVSPRVHSAPLVARLFGQHPNAESLDIHVANTQMKILNKVLLQRSPSNPDTFRNWVSLKLLTLHIDFHTAIEPTPFQMWYTHISAVMARPTLAIQVRFKSHRVPKAWVDESKALLGERFSWISSNNADDED